MPLFEYSCTKCNNEFEEYHPKYTEKKPKCPTCGARTERMYSVAAFHDFNRIMRSSDAQPYVTSNISGKPMEIRSHAQLQKACKEYGVIHAPSEKR